MRVFNTCIRIVKRRSAALIIYFVIFAALSVVMTNLSVDKYSTDFVASKPAYTVINRDQESPLTQGVRELLARYGEEVLLADEEEELKDAAFYHASDYILMIPLGFSESFGSENSLKLETMTTPDSAKGYYLDSLVNQYMNLADSWRILHPEWTEQQIVDTVLQDLSKGADVEIRQFGSTQPVSQQVQIFYMLNSYIMLVFSVLSLSILFMAFRKPDLHMRNLCSPLTSRSMNLQIGLCGMLLGTLFWILLTILGLFLYGGRLEGTDPRSLLLLMLNSFLFLLVSLSIGLLAGNFIKSGNSQNAAANFLSLGMSFLGGAFVPLDMLGAGMLQVARFVPTYWYITALNKICSLSSFTASSMKEIWQAMAVQIGFAVAILCVSLVLSKYMGQSEKNFGAVRTEVEL